MLSDRSSTTILRSSGASGSPSAERTCTGATGTPLRRSTSHGRGSDASERISAPHSRSAVTTGKNRSHLGQDVCVVHVVSLVGMVSTTPGGDQPLQVRRQSRLCQPGYVPPAITETCYFAKGFVNHQQGPLVAQNIQRAGRPGGWIARVCCASASSSTTRTSTSPACSLSYHSTIPPGRGRLACR
jgi:hypothetical protein